MKTIACKTPCAQAVELSIKNEQLEMDNARLRAEIEKLRQTLKISMRPNEGGKRWLKL